MNHIMGKITCTRRLEWDAMHRIPNHESSCRAFHGHRYVAEIECEADALDELGRVIDFGLVKAKVGSWIDEYWDHTAILAKDDPEAGAVAEVNARMQSPVYWLSAHPTAENMVAELARVSQELLSSSGITIARIRLWETPNCSAVWQL